MNNNKFVRVEINESFCIMNRKDAIAMIIDENNFKPPFYKIVEIDIGEDEFKNLKPFDGF